MAERIGGRVVKVGGSPSSLELFSVVDVIYSHRWIFVCAFLVVFITGLIYAVIAQPVYRANLVIQLEEPGEVQPHSFNEYVADVSSIVAIKSNADGEIQIFNSKLVVGEAVDALNLAVSAQPVYFSFGRVIARIAQELGFRAYARGNGSIDVRAFDISKLDLGRSFKVKALAVAQYELTGPGIKRPVIGRVGEMLTTKTANGPLTLRVAGMHGEPGTEFVVRRVSRAAAIRNLRRAIEVEEQGNRSDVLSATLSGADPVVVSATLNAIGQAYVRQNAECKAVRAQASLDFLNSQLPELKQQVEQAEQRYNEYRNKHASMDISEQARLLLGQSSMAETSLYLLEQRRQEIVMHFAGTHPVLAQFDKQIEATRRFRDSIIEHVRELPVDEQDAIRLVREVRVSADVYGTLLSNIVQLKLVRAGKISAVRVVDNADVPEVPTKPNRLLIVAISAVAALFAGLSLAFGLNVLKKGVVDPVELEGVSLQLYGAIPMSVDELRFAKMRNATASDRLLAVRCPQDAAVEGLRVLRTAVRVAMIGARNNVVMLSGPMPHIGKSFASANFAALIAAGGKRVLLVDADLRRGHMHRILGLPWARGLAEVMEGSLLVDQAIRRNVLPDLDFLGVGRYPDNPSELLLRGDFQRALEVVVDDYDVVVVDAAAILAVSDVAIIALAAGTIVLLARYGVTRAFEISTAVQRLNQAGCKVNGLVLNAVPEGAGSNAYARRYGGRSYKAYYQKLSSS
jgi:tyrosine-protein kinase Etk/Wzc